MCVLDATVGGGGHSKEVLRRIIPGGTLIVIDKDAEAIERVRGKFKEFVKVITFIKDDFRNIEKILNTLGIKGIDRALFDLGMSSFQIDNQERGFSFLQEGPLDMRFDPGEGITAGEIVNTFEQSKLTDIIKSFGEERHALLVARRISAARKIKRIETTIELKDIIIGAIGLKYKKQRLHPAARTFQALRIYVNDELASAEEGINRAVDCLRPRGRICVLSFHSLEDRIVKNIFRSRARNHELKMLTKKPITPGREETRVNPRSRSAKLRAAERL